MVITMSENINFRAKLLQEADREIVVSLSVLQEHKVIPNMYVPNDRPAKQVSKN